MLINHYYAQNYASIMWKTLLINREVITEKSQTEALIY